MTVTNGFKLESSPLICYNIRWLCRRYVYRPGPMCRGHIFTTLRAWVSYILSKRRQLGGKNIYYDHFVDAGIDISSGWLCVVARIHHVRKFRRISSPFLVETFSIEISRIVIHVDAGVDTLIRVHRITRWYVDRTRRIVSSSDVEGSLQSSYDVSWLILVMWGWRIGVIILPLLLRQVGIAYPRRCSHCDENMSLHEPLWRCQRWHNIETVS